MECQLVKAEHQHPTKLLKPLSIREWKWETISLDFITYLPHTRKQHDSIMVVVDKLSKTTHFIPVKSTFKTMEIVEIFMKEIFRLHGIPKVVIFDRGVKFTSTFWKTLIAGLGTQIHFSIAYHSQTDGQTEWVNQVLEDMLRMFMMQQPHKWQDCLHLVEFSYNNQHHESLCMIPFEVLYGRQCRVPIDCNNSVNKLALGPDMLAEIEEVVKKVRQNLRRPRVDKRCMQIKRGLTGNFNPETTFT